MFDRLRERLARAFHREALPTKAELAEELAAPSLTGIRQVWRESVADNLTPSRLAGILKSAALGDGDDYLTLAEDMEERDLHYASVLGTRKLAVAGLDVRVDSSSDDVTDVRRADALREVVAAPEFGELVAHLTDALGKGYAVAEILWDRSGATWTPRFAPRDARFFVYDQADGVTLRLRDEANTMQGIPLAPYKFIVHTPKIRSGLPIRGGLARLAAVAYLCKAWSWRDWMAFADIYGLPMRVGRYNKQSATKEDIAKLMAAVANLGSDAAAVMPDSMRIEFEQAAQTTGAGEFFRALAEFWDRQVSKGVLGQTMTADDGASLSQAQVHNDVRLDLLTADAKALQNTLNRELVRPFIDLNFGPGAYPRLVVVVPKPEDTALLVDALTRLVPLGLEVEQSVIRDKLGLPDPAPDAVLLRAPAAASAPAAEAPPPALNRAMNTESTPDYVDALAETMAERAGGAVDAWIARIRAEVAQATGYDDLLGRLSMLLTELPLDELGDAIAQGAATAALAGQSDVQDEGDA